jgi:hypothetical protein
VLRRKFYCVVSEFLDTEDVINNYIVVKKHWRKPEDRYQIFFEGLFPRVVKKEVFRFWFDTREEAEAFRSRETRHICISMKDFKLFRRLHDFKGT